MATETIGVYGASDIKAVVLPNTVPPAYPINIGSTFVSMTVNNISPYFISISDTSGGMPFATISPWTITPVNFDMTGTIYISVNASLGTSDSSSVVLQGTERVFVSLSTSINTNQMIQLSPNVNSNVVNTSLQTNPLVKLGSVTYNVVNLGAGQGMPITFNASGTGVYDELHFMLESNITNPPYQITASNTYWLDPIDNTRTVVTSASSTSISFVPASFSPTTNGRYFVLELTQATVISSMKVTITNSSGSTIASDTVTVTIYGKNTDNIMSIASVSAPQISQIASISNAVLGINANVTVYLAGTALTTSFTPTGGFGATGLYAAYSCSLEFTSTSVFTGGVTAQFFDPAVSSGSSGSGVSYGTSTLFNEGLNIVQVFLPKSAVQMALGTYIKIVNTNAFVITLKNSKIIGYRV